MRSNNWRGLEHPQRDPYERPKPYVRDRVDVVDVPRALIRERIEAFRRELEEDGR